MPTTREEILKDDESGKFYVWKITESEVPGEGARLRGPVMNMSGITRHELALREKLDEINAMHAETMAALSRTLEFKDQIQKEEGGA